MILRFVAATGESIQVVFVYSAQIAVEMTTADTATAVTALVVSLFALFTAVAQLLQQYFGAADGLRRCQAPIIGEWAKNTRLRFRWREFRFEVTFIAPVIGINREESLPGANNAPRGPESDGKPDLFLWNALGITGTSLSRRMTFSPEQADQDCQDTFIYDEKEVMGMAVSKLRKDGPTDMVGWISLIDRLHILQSVGKRPMVSVARDTKFYNKEAPTQRLRSWDIAKYLPCHPTIPSIAIRQRSWDFMPPDFLRPVASSTVGDIIVLAHRLGMGWRSLKPGAGVLHAEGNGQTLTGSMVRSFGIVLQYTRDHALESRSAEHAWQNLIIPTEEADKVGFGIIPGDDRLGMPDLPMTAEDGSFDEIDASMSALNITRRAQNVMREVWRQHGYYEGWNEVICLACPFLPMPEENSINCVLRPLQHIASPLLWREGRRAFRIRTRHEADILNSSSKSPKLAKHLENLWQRYITGWKTYPSWGSETFFDKSTRNCYSKEFLMYLKGQHDWTTDYFLNKEPNTLKHERGQDLEFKDLLSAHLSMAPSAWPVARENDKKGNYKRAFGESKRMFEVFQVYADRLPEVAERVKETSGFDDEEVVREAWWSLMYRGQVWWLSVQILGGPHRTPDDRRGIYVPSSYWGSKVPVYIA